MPLKRVEFDEDDDRVEVVEAPVEPVAVAVQASAPAAPERRARHGGSWRLRDDGSRELVEAPTRRIHRHS